MNSIENLRPISILCSISKAFEKLMKDQMQTYINHNNLLTEFQAGFRKGHSTKTAVIRVYDDFAAVVDKKGSGILVLLDFSKAFDTVSHRKLCEKLCMQFNFSSKAVSLLSSYLNNRKQTVYCNGKFSRSAVVESGVPQGSVLGPLLFCCYINDLPSVLKHCSIQLYADDVQLYVLGRSRCARELAEMVNADLESVTGWCIQNGLQVNNNKSKALYITSRRR